jgi:hypothetical protein
MFAFLGLGLGEMVILGLIAVAGIVFLVVLKSTGGFTKTVVVFMVCAAVFVVCAASAGIAAAILNHRELTDDGRVFCAFILVFFGLASVALPILIALGAILVIVTKAANEMITGLQYIDADVRKGRSARPPESQGGTGADTGIKPT